MNRLTILYNDMKYNVVSVPLNMKIKDLKEKIKKKINIDNDFKMMYFNNVLDDNKLVVDYNFTDPILIINKKYNYNVEKIINYSFIGLGLLFLFK